MKIHSTHAVLGPLIVARNTPWLQFDKVGALLVCRHLSTVDNARTEPLDKGSFRDSPQLAAAGKLQNTGQMKHQYCINDASIMRQ